jgi:hypothetical protein
MLLGNLDIAQIQRNLNDYLARNPSLAKQIEATKAAYKPGAGLLATTAQKKVPAPAISQLPKSKLVIAGRQIGTPPTLPYTPKATPTTNGMAADGGQKTAAPSPKPAVQPGQTVFRPQTSTQSLGGLLSSPKPALQPAPKPTVTMNGMGADGRQITTPAPKPTPASAVSSGAKTWATMTTDERLVHNLQRNDGEWAREQLAAGNITQAQYNAALPKSAPAPAPKPVVQPGQTALKPQAPTQTQSGLLSVPKKANEDPNWNRRTAGITDFDGYGSAEAYVNTLNTKQLNDLVQYGPNLKVSVDESRAISAAASKRRNDISELGRQGQVLNPETMGSQEGWSDLDKRRYQSFMDGSMTAGQRQQFLRTNGSRLNIDPTTLTAQERTWAYGTGVQPDMNGMGSDGGQRRADNTSDWQGSGTHDKDGNIIPESSADTDRPGAPRVDGAPQTPSAPVVGGTAGGATSDGGGPASSGGQFFQFNETFDPNGSDPTLRNIGADEIVAAQLDAMLQSDSPLMRQAAESGKRYAASRGLLNSTLAGEAAQEAMIRNALPVAQQDSRQLLEQGLANQDYFNRFALQRDQQVWASGESALDRAANRDLRAMDIEAARLRQEAEMAFTAGQAQMDRDFTADRDAAAQEFTSSENREARDAQEAIARDQAYRDAVMQAGVNLSNRLSNIDANTETTTLTKQAQRDQAYRDYDDEIARINQTFGRVG